MKTPFLLLLFLTPIWCRPLAAQGVPDSVAKWLPSPQASNSSPAYGQSMAVSETWILVGVPLDDTQASNAGCVDVHDAKTGRKLRQLFAPDARGAASFGHSLALCGDLAVIGAQTDATRGFGSGAAYLMNVRTGKAIVRLDTTDLGPTERLGSQVAINQHWTLVSAIAENSFQGAVYVFETATGAFVERLVRDDGESWDLFGGALYLHGDMALIGESGESRQALEGGEVHGYNLRQKNWVLEWTASDASTSGVFGCSLAGVGEDILVGAYGTSSKRGAVYHFDLKTGQELRKLVPNDEATFKQFGISVAAFGGLALIGANEDDEAAADAGAAYVYDIASGTQLHKIVASDLVADARFGSTLACGGGRALIGSPRDDTILTEGGALYVYEGLRALLPAQVSSQKGGAALPLPDTFFSAFTSFQINRDGETLFQANLRGTAKRGLWRNDIEYTLLMARRDAFLGESVADVSLPVMQHRDHALFQARLSGSGVTSTTDRVLVGDDGNQLAVLLREGDTLATGGFSSAVVKTLSPHAGSTTESLAAVPLKLSADRSTDSALALLALPDGSILQSLREGAASPYLDIALAEITQRAAISGSDFIATVALSSDSATNAAVVTGDTLGTVTGVARKGESAPGTVGTFSSFLGAGLSPVGEPILRALVKGTPTSQREGVWADRLGTLTLLAQKGTPVVGLDGGETFARFIRVWSLPGGRAMLWVRLGGRGVTSSKDHALLFAPGDGTFAVMAREGDNLPSGPGRIKVIQSVGVDPESGAYTVLASLTGVPTATNQALFRGMLTPIFSLDLMDLMRPFELLRKGMPVQHEGTSATVASVKMLPPSEQTGIGARGIGSVIAGTRIALQLTLSDKRVLVGTVE